MLVDKIKTAFAVLGMMAATLSIGAVIALSGRTVTLSALHADRVATAGEAAARYSGSGLRPSDGTLTAVADYEIYDSGGDLVAARPTSAEFVKPARLSDSQMSFHNRAMRTGRVLTAEAQSFWTGVSTLSPPAPAVLYAPFENSAGTGSIRLVLAPNEAGRALVGTINATAFIAAFLSVLAIGSMFYFHAKAGPPPAQAPRADLGTSRNRDPLTGLPNRGTFLTRLDELIAGDPKRERQFSVVTIDVDRFKSVNDTWEHVVGDTILQEVVRRVRPLVGDEATMGRMSGDEFAVVLEEDANPRSLKQLARRILDRLSEPFRVGEVEITLSASAGIAVYPVNADTGAGLFRAADLALYKAKSEGGHTFRFFDTEMEKHLKRRSALEHDLRHALKREEFVVFYQPQMNLNTGELCGYEALVRWERPGEGIVSPMDFIPVAEETGLIKPLGEWVLRRACEDAVSWIEKGTIAVNFSAAQFRYSGVDVMIERVLEETGLDPRRLEIELTEGLFLNHSPDVMEALNRIKALGVRIAMDDFGTGYSSLSYLTRFPFDKIKIDRSFVSQLSEDPQIATIISSIVGLGRSLSVDITAEGVETNDQVTLLQAAGCSIVQGFLFGAPQRAGMPIAPIASRGSPVKAGIGA